MQPAITKRDEQYKEIQCFFAFLLSHVPTSCHLLATTIYKRKYISVTTVMKNRWTPEDPGKTGRTMYEDPGYSQGALGPGAPRLGNRRQKYCLQRRCRIAIAIGPHMTQYVNFKVSASCHHLDREEAGDIKAKSRLGVSRQPRFVAWSCVLL